MASEEGANALKLYWDHFFKAETGTYEKSTWLDLFLAEFIVRLNEGCDPKDLIKFCPVSGVVSLVGCELLCGIHRVTSSINTHYSPPPPASLDVHAADSATHAAAAEEQRREAALKSSSLFTRTNTQSSAEILRQYLLGGLAWRCLLLLKALGVEGLSCCRQLSSVLIWLFGELSAAGRAPSADRNIKRDPRVPIHQLFSNRIWSKQKPNGGQPSTGTSGKGCVTPRSRYNGLTRLDSDTKSMSFPKKKSAINAEMSSDSGDTNEELQALNRSMAIKPPAPPARGRRSPAPPASSDALYSDPFRTPRKAKPKADDYMGDKHKDIINSEISTFEFTLIIIDLLQELCKAESSLTGSEGSQISMQCINFSLKNLCSLQFGSMPAQSAAYEPEELSSVKVALTELLIVSLDQVLVHSDLCAKLINIGILPMLLRILEDVVCKSCAKYNTKAERQNRAKEMETPTAKEADNLLKFIFGIAYSITAFFYCLLMQCRSVEKLREFTDQFRLYGECFKGGLLKECIELMIRIPGVNSDETVILIKKLIESIGKLVSGMKRVRSEVIHRAACPRARHKGCRARVAAGRHHHHDLLGDAGTGLPLPAACCVSVLYATLTALVPDEEISAHKVLRNKILHVMLKCGVCCCFSSSFLMESIVRLMLTHNSVATLCLRLLEHTVYGDLGASVLVPKVTDQLPCSICEQCDDNRDLGRKYCAHGVSPMERKSVWSFLIHYNSLLQLDNHNSVLHATVSHLLKVTPKCRTEMKYELLFSVIYPTFIVSKHRYIIRLEESAYFLTVSCLNIFANLLNTVSFAEQFIQKGGLSYVLELISLSEFSSQCCAILEIAIIVEIYKLMKENAELTYFREMNSLASVQILFKSLTEVTNKCYSVFKTQIPLEKFEELCDTNKEKETLALGSPAVEARKVSVPIAIKSIKVDTETDDGEDASVEVFKNLWTFWGSCAALCLHSPMFREYTASEPVFVESYALLKLLLHALCRAQGPPAHTRALIKIMEAVLTVQFAVSDATSGRSKETSCSVVRSALSEHARAAGEWRGAASGLRALCDALIGVAVAFPAARHPANSFTPAKVPSLSYGSGGSSAECSSSEDSACGPYLEPSEHSDPLDRPDDGYEADVELGKLEATNMFKTRKLSDSSIFSYVSGDKCIEAISKECPEYNRNGELTHPELCVIVVDILTQLIDKLLEEEDGKVKDGKDASGVLASGGEEIERVCASVARACVARLGCGLAPPRLLHRLLAPDAPAARLLARNSLTHAELQRSIIELIVKLGSQSMESCELASIFRLASASSAPLGSLCRALARLAARDRPQPDCELLLAAAPRAGEEPIYEEVVRAVNQQAETFARRARYRHLRAGISSPWSAGAVRCSLETAGWAPWLQGFALLAWLALAPPPQEEKYEWREEPREPGAARGPLHVFSVGHDSLVFELWAAPADGELTVRLTRPEDDANCVLSSATARTTLRPGRWTCLALNVAERLHRRLIYIQVTLYINGRECEVLSLPLQGILVRKATPTNVIIGDVSGCAGGAAGAAGAGGAAGAVRVSSVRVYRAPVLAAPAALHLAAHGPDMPCQIRCDSANYPSVITPELLDSNIDWDQVYEISSATLREVNDNLLLLFSANSPDVMHLYQPPAPTPTVFGSRGVGGRSLCSSGVPEPLRCSWAARPRSLAHRTVHNALLSLGGPELVLFLYARVVEAGGGAEEQARALGVALAACRGDARLHAALHARDTLDMLLPVFACPDCRLAPHTVAVIFREACDRSVIETSGGVVRVDVGTRAVLLEPRLLLLLLRASRYLDAQPEVQWEEVDLSIKSDGGDGGDGCEERERGARAEVCSGSAWSLALAAACALLRADHPRRAFNSYQAARVPLLRHLLLACKERFLNSDSEPLSERGSATLVRLVRALLDAPPLLANIALLADFLLLMHQASETFITHSRANFYFLVTSETPDSNEFNLLQLLSKRRGKQPVSRWRSRDGMDKSSSSSVSNEEKGSHEELPRDTDSDRADNYNPDSKQTKSIINTRIKEDRKSVSSTSEYSDATTAEIGGSEADGAERADPLGEYVVIGAGDVGRADGDVYADGLYQQRGVRAGAEPGWSACSGLLLLLRDTILNLPQDMLPQAVGGAIQPEQLAVLANHRSAAVRAGVVRVVRALHARDARALAAAMHAHFYLHLANQISMYEGSWELAEACAALLTGRERPLEDQLDDEVWIEAEESRMCMRAAPLLAVLPACLADVPLAHNIIAVLRRLVDRCSVKSLYEVALSEVLVRCISAVGGAASDAEGRELLLEDLQDLLARFAVKVLAGNHSMQLIVDMHHLLSFVERGGNGEAEGEAGAEGAEGSARAAREAQVALYVAQLDHLESRLHQLHLSAADKITGYFSNVLSSAVEGGRGARGERGEVAARHAGTVARAVAFLLARSPRRGQHCEGRLLFRLLDTLLAGVNGNGAARGRWRWGGGAEWAGLLGEVFWWAASPAAGVRALQPRLLRALYCAPPAARDLLAPRDPSHMRKLSVYLLTMIRHIHLAAESGAETGDGLELAITDWARDWAVGSQADLPERPLPAEAERLLRADELRWAKTYNAHAQAAQIAKAVFGRAALAARACETAMAATRRVVDAQNGERKAFLEHLREAHARLARAHTRWARALDAHAHERGVWHRARGYPTSWQLDSTEGPARVRLRLRRAHLRLPPDKLQPAHRHKIENATHPPPLRSVLAGGAGGAARGARLQRGEVVLHMARVLHVSVAAETGGELLLTDRALHFVPDALPGALDGGEGACWPAASVYAAATRRWCLQERAVEVFVRPARAHLLAFETPPDRSAFLAHLARLHPHIKTEPESLTEAMNQWRNGLITNWEYLMILNGLAGRSYNDLMQYPVVPFVLADYTSKVLDLTDPASFRDLSKPMAVQNKNREQHYINTYNDLKAARRTGCSPLLSRQPHHYASLYSNSGGVLHYLVRVPPFTEQFLSYQDNNFDMPDRTFHSLATTWRLITNDSPTDVKELIPELYYLPELFYNNEGLELGVRQCGLRVDSVELPRWAADARLFTLAHRQALEAPHVAEGLPHWIDLVFGYKQTGQHAVDAVNVFPACTYYGFDPTALEDEVDRTAAEAMVRTYGQAPRQLLRAPHPHRAPDLSPQTQLSAASSIYAGVRGVRWGRYCGSPGAPAARQVLRRTYASAHALLPLPHARAAVVALAGTALMPVHDEPIATGSGTAGNKSSGSNGPNVGLNVGLVSWGHGDGAVRLRRRRDLPPDILFHTPPTEQITAVHTWQEGRWGCALGLSGGGVVVARAECCGGVLRVRARQLHAHAAPLAHVDAQPAVTLLVTASEDGVIVLWDLHELTYIRTLPNRDMLRVRLVAISPTSSDVASVHEPARAPAAGPGGLDYEHDDTYKYKSLVRVHTVNGRFVGSVKVAETVRCVRYSACAEGTSVNCIAVGLRSGAIRLYSAWDLRPLAHLPPPQPSPQPRPAPPGDRLAQPDRDTLSIAYSHDNELLFASYADGGVVAWESLEPAAKPAPVRLLPAHALL